MTSPKGRILCTEDDQDTRELIIFILQDEGYEVLCTDNGIRPSILSKHKPLICT
jgi:CheY-like chemotaxis protein